jgi:hypothetical protein
MFNNDDVQEAFIFELQMFLMFGLFWAMIISIPLIMTSSFDNPKNLPANLLMMAGLYLAYLVFRLSVALGRSFMETYKISNQADVTANQKRGAEEWMTFILLVGVWGGVMAWPLAINDFFIKASKIPVAVLIIVLPYVLYWVGKAFLQQPPPPPSE